MEADVYNTYRVSRRNFTISQTGPNCLQNYFAERDPHPLFEKLMSGNSCYDLRLPQPWLGLGLVTHLRTRLKLTRLHNQSRHLIAARGASAAT